MQLIVLCEPQASGRSASKIITITIVTIIIIIIPITWAHGLRGSFTGVICLGSHLPVSSLPLYRARAEVALGHGRPFLIYWPGKVQDQGTASAEGAREWRKQVRKIELGVC